MYIQKYYSSHSIEVPLTPVPSIREQLRLQGIQSAIDMGLGNRGLLHALIKKEAFEVFRKATPDIRKDRELALSALKQDARVWMYLPESLTHDPEFLRIQQTAIESLL